MNRLRRLPTPEELDRMAWPARHELATRLRVHPTKLRDYLHERQVQRHKAGRRDALERAIADAWDADRPTRANPLTTCDGCGMTRARNYCHTCALFTERTARL